MSVIEASSAGFKDMADGTVRFFFDVEPRNAGAALELFRARGTGAALAALKPDYLIGSNPPDSGELKPETIKGGELAKLAGMWCNDPKFWYWLMEYDFMDAHNSDDAVQFIYDICDIKSRAELDHNPAAAERFHQLIRVPFSEWLKQ